jgi:hypothetical protein
LSVFNSTIAPTASHKTTGYLRRHPSIEAFVRES